MTWIDFLGLEGLVTYSLAKQTSFCMAVQGSYLWLSVRAEDAHHRETVTKASVNIHFDYFQSCLIEGVHIWWLVVKLP